MPSFNLGQLMSNATARIGRRSDLATSDVSYWVNTAYMIVQTQAPSQLQERIATSSTTSGENRISLPTDFYQPINLSYLTDVGSRRTLVLTGPDKVDAEGFTPVGISDRYVLYSDWMELHPSPDSAYSLQLRYLSYATDLVNTTDVPSLSTPWRYAVQLKSEQLLAELLNDELLSAKKANDYLAYTSTLDTDQAKRQLAVEGQRVSVIYGAPKKA